ncbi:hypothetical protein [Virgibacillus sp. JSM 102003]|uniref:hypothetical protein n=1 Tax=Virgibacillus sp. JSM 102003 TaxID=1562108 RepID=UPI0035BF8FFE
MSIALIIIITFLLLFLYHRYMPVFGVGKMDMNYVSYSKEDVAIVDTRDYQDSFNDIIEQAYSIPVPYLNRHFHDIPDKNIVVIASDIVGRNVSTRILRNKGKRVVGYHMVKN